MTNFADTGLNDSILSSLEKLGFETPTPIQEESIPFLLNSKQDLIASAQTGTGKTAAFGLPAIQNTDIENKKTQTIILCPTRELCIQIAKDLKNYSKDIKGIGIVAVYGGTNIMDQIRELNKKAHIVVGTPGRTNDLIRRKKLFLGSIDRVILDEADEMLTMGFKEEIDSILAETPPEKQTILFSATMSKGIISITKKFMRDPEKISVAKVNTTAKNVKHVYYMVQAKDRYEVLKRVADMNPDVYGIVFCRTRRETKEIAAKFMNDGYNADALHGDLSQAQRDEVMDRFRQRQLQMLIATDVAARGLDVNDLTHVINFNLPDDPEVYVHRSGRTGRAGKNGISIAIVHTRELRRIKDIERISGTTFIKELVPTGKDICQKQLYSLIDKIEKVKVDEHQIEPFLSEIYAKLEWLSREELIKHFVSAEFNRFLTYYKNARDINVSDRGLSDSKGRDSRGKREKKGKRSNTNFARIHINVGSNNHLNPARLIGLINEGLDSGNSEIGSIDIMKKFSFFEIEDKLEGKLKSALKDFTFDGVDLHLETAQPKPNTDSDDGDFPRKRNFGKKRDFKRNKRNSDGGGRNKRRD